MNDIPKSKSRNRPQSDITADLRSLVESNPGIRLPSERDLAEQFGVSRPRIRQALQSLEAEGMVEIRRGSGAYAVSGGESVIRGVTLLIDAHLKLGDDPFFSTLVQRLQAAIQFAGMRCGVASVGPDSAKLPRDDAYITLGGIDLSSLGIPADRPVVALMPMQSNDKDGDVPQPATNRKRITVFQLDDRAGGRDALRRLTDLGCKSVIFAGRLNIEASHLRFEGAHAAADELGIAIKLRTCRLNYAGGLSFGAEIARSGVAANTGIIATNDWLAAGIRAGLDSESKRETLPIVSFDGLPLAGNPMLRIESLAVPLDDIAADAVADLQRLASRATSSGRIVVYPMTWRS